MDRTERQRRAGKLKVWAVVTALAGLGTFSGLVVTGTRLQRQDPPPAEQISRLQNYLGYPFWDTASNKVSPPQYLPVPAKASSGGS
ncbi:MAG: hypothetical protein NVSMB22_22220 [Chloroflexota bacterium]